MVWHGTSFIDSSLEKLEKLLISSFVFSSFSTCKDKRCCCCNAQCWIKKKFPRVVSCLIRVTGLEGGELSCHEKRTLRVRYWPVFWGARNDGHKREVSQRSKNKCSRRTTRYMCRAFYQSPVHPPIKRDYFIDKCIVWWTQNALLLFQNNGSTFR